ncbi:MAG: signal peptidase I [Actinomycetota bacterium]
MIGRSVHRLTLVLIWIVIGGFGGLFLAVTVPYAFGSRSLTVLSGSMEPTLHVGDVVVVEQVPPLDVRVGDIVTFRDPTDASRLITHRVREIDVEGRNVGFVTKGDANTSVEHWSTDTDGTIGRVRFHVWRLGYLMFWIRSPLGRLALVVVPALLLGAFELRRIWRPVTEDDDDGHGRETREPDDGESDEAAA